MVALLPLTMQTHYGIIGRKRDGRIPKENKLGIRDQIHIIDVYRCKGAEGK